MDQQLPFQNRAGLGWLCWGASTPMLRHLWEEWLTITRCPASPKMVKLWTMLWRKMQDITAGYTKRGGVCGRREACGFQVRKQQKREHTREPLVQGWKTCTPRVAYAPQKAKVVYAVTGAIQEWECITPKPLGVAHLYITISTAPLEAQLRMHDCIFCPSQMLL